MRLKQVLAVGVLVAGWFGQRAIATEFTLELAPGWNLVSLPVLPVASSPEVVFSGASVRSVWEWDAADMRFRAPAELVPGRGYWVYCTGEGGPVHIEGAAPVRANAYLDAGWNLVGPVPGYQRLVTDGLGDVCGWDAARGEYAALAGEAYEAGQGCWMYAAAPLVVDFSTYTLQGVVTGEAVAGVTVSLSGTAEAQTTTAADGTFAFSGLRTGVYCVTPSVQGRDGVVFVPEARPSIWLNGADVAGVAFDATDGVVDTSFLDLEAPGFLSSTTDAFAVRPSVRLVPGATVNEAEQTITLATERAVVVGDVLVGDETARFAKVVTALDSIDGNTVATVRDATLGEILADDSAFAFRVTPDWNRRRSAVGRTLSGANVGADGAIALNDVSLLELKVNANGVVDWAGSTLMGESLDLPTADDSLHAAQLSEGQITAKILTGTLNVTPTFDLEYGLNGSNPRAEGSMDAHLVVDLQVQVATTAAARLDVSGTLLPELSVPVTISTAAGIPIYLDLDLEIPAGVKLDADGAGTLVFHQRSEYTVHADLAYAAGSALQVTKQVDRTYGVRELTPTTDGRMAAEVCLDPKVTVELYRIPGPYLWVHPYLRGEVSYPLARNQDELFVGINGGLGLGLGNLFFGTLDRTGDALFDTAVSWDLLGPSDVGSTNTPPVAMDQTVTVTSADGTGTALRLASTDVDGDALRYAIATYPAHGTLSPLDPESGRLRYYPAVGYTGTDSFTFAASDGFLPSAPATVLLDVVADRPPTARFVANATGLAVAFDAADSRDAEDSTSDLRVRWDFDGDQAWDTDWSTAKTANHTYSQAGTYVVCCQVQDTTGLADTQTRVLCLVAATTNSMPVPDLRLCVNDYTASLDATGSTDAEDSASRTPLEFRWAWSPAGDFGAWRTAATGEHTYSRAGAHEVLLQVRDSAGNVVETMTRVTVGEGIGYGDYLAVDLSVGPMARTYPTRYLPAEPAGGWPDECKSTKLVLRRIPAGTFTMGSPTDELGRGTDETQHEVALTTDFYIGVFEVTQRQWERVMGTWPSDFDNTTYRDMRPVEKVSYNDIRGGSDGAGWPSSNAVDADSFLGKLRQKAQLAALDLPTESQWEYACRAGTTTALNSGKDLTSSASCPNMGEVGRYYYNGGADYNLTDEPWAGTAVVGTYLPNAWGLYDMHGNVWEWCLDWYGVSYPGPSTDPTGAATGTNRTNRGGCWTKWASNCRSATRGSYGPNVTFWGLGLRLALPTP
jgi:formylglycine-generating enzyme required for sulfatase activity